jgi:hypothetical protein
MAKKLSRQDIVAKINAFLNMTVERGASESEALTAAKHAAALLAEYDLTFADLTDTEETMGKADVFEFRDDLSRFMHTLSEAIAELCAVEVLIYGPGTGKIKLVGSSVDVDFARYLAVICLRALEDQAEKAGKKYALLRINVRRRQVESILQGMGHRLSERLRELAWARRSAMSNAVVVAKEDIIQETMKGLGIKTRMIPFRERDADPAAYKIGIESANRVALNNAVHARNHEFDASLEDKDEDEGDSEVLLLGHG